MSVLVFLGGSIATNAQEYVQTQYNSRQFVVTWQENSLFMTGQHRPYSLLQIQNESGESIAEGNTDAIGTFSMVLSSAAMNSTVEQTLTLEASDQFGRKVLNESGAPDVLSAIVPSRLQTTGTTHPYATITLLSTDQKVLRKFQADNAGNYTITNAPEGSLLQFEYNEETTLMSFEAEEMPPVFFTKEADNEESTLHKVAEEDIFSEPKNRESNIFSVAFAIFTIGSIFLGFFLWIRRRFRDV